MHSHPYERTHANPTPMSIFEDWAGIEGIHRCHAKREKTMNMMKNTYINETMIDKFVVTR